MKIEILDQAEKDLIDGFAFYEGQSKGLREYFLDSVFADIESLRLYAGIHSQHFGYYRLLAKRFPFAVYYRIQRKVIQVYAVLDCRRNPSWTLSRLI
jgi:plasmid stabilization system protein ParE